MFQFVNNCCFHKEKNFSPHLTIAETQVAEAYWVSVIQRDHFTKEIQALKDDRALHNSSAILSLHPILNSSGVLRVGGRSNNSQMS